MRQIIFFDQGLSPFSGEYTRRLNKVAYAALGFAEIEESLITLLLTPPPEPVLVPPQPFTALLGAAVALAGEENQWEYPWVTGLVDDDTGQVVVDENGRVGTIEDETAARNYAEQLNSATKAAHGLPVAGDPIVTAEVLAIPEGTPVVMFQVRRSAGERAYRFSEVNAVNFECLAP